MAERRPQNPHLIGSLLLVLAIEAGGTDGLELVERHHDLLGRGRRNPDRLEDRGRVPTSSAA
jgi:hypothetical protein